tara:strand:- start:239 stop:751 length:513 start_codon:yes stop_codon:yes gene_type:complete
MLKRYYYWFLFLSGIIGFTLGVTLKVAWEESQFILAEWEDDPILVICPDSKLTNYRVNRAVEWWGIRGYNIAYVHWDRDNEICKNSWSNGMILVRGEGELLPDTYAITSRLTILNKMVSAQIILPNEHKFMPRLLEHEIGHALGMKHVEEIGHMMHPIHEQGGEKFWIPD